MRSHVESQTEDLTAVLEQSVSDVASAIADPSRVSILCALMDGRAWTATELSSVAGIAASTASAHLAKLMGSHLITCLSQGRHRYYRLAGHEVASLLEALMGISTKAKTVLVTKTPDSLRLARTCYDHLAGEIAVAIYDFMIEEDWLLPDSGTLSPKGIAHYHSIGAKTEVNSRRKNACGCLDWSERRYHLGGSAGAALLAAFECNLWLIRTPGYREITFTAEGKKALFRYFRLKIN